VFTVEECNYILESLTACRKQYEENGITRYLPTVEENTSVFNLVMSRSQISGFYPIIRQGVWCIIHQSDTPLGLHTDGAPRYTHQSLIPLKGNGSTIVFEQRWNGDHNLDPVTTKTSNLLNFGDHPFDIDFYNNYLTHIDYELLSGLTVQSCYKWKIGDIFNFNHTKIHCSGNLSGPKTGLTILWSI